MNNDHVSDCLLCCCFFPEPKESKNATRHVSFASDSFFLGPTDFKDGMSNLW